MIRYYFLFYMLLGCSQLYSQAEAKKNTTAYSLANIGYANLNGNYLELGYDVYLVNDKNLNILTFGAGVDLAYFSDSFVAVPYAQGGIIFNKKGSKTDPYAKEFNEAFYVARAKVSPWHIQPEIGLSVLSLLEVNFGWGFEFNSHPNQVHFNGPKLGLNLRLPFQLFY